MRVVFLALLVLTLSGCEGQWSVTKTPGPRKVTIAMGFVPNVQFAPMYVALERGYFAEEGLDVELDYGMETDLLQSVGTGKLQFAIASGDQVVLARANGLPVTYFYNWYRRFPVCVVSLTEQGIEEPQQLADRTVGIPALQGASYIGWLAFLDQVALAENVNLQVVGYTQVASLVEKRVDAAVCYALNEPIQLAQAGYDVNVFYFDEYVDLVSNGIITNERTIEREPELVRAVARAFSRGLQDTIQDPDAAFAITRQAIPEMNEEAARLQRAVLDECLLYWKADKLGYNRPESWQASVALLSELDLVSEPVDSESLYTNRFIE